MSNLWARTYDYPATVTASDTVDDPAGPFAGAVVAATFTGVVYPLSGPQRASGITFTALPAGTELHFPIKRIGASGLTGTILGLVSSIKKQGPST